MGRARVLCVAGTRPEAIKMAPVILALRAGARVDCRVVATAQHRDMLDQVFRLFGIKPDLDLDLMRPDQALADLTARMLLALDRTLQEERPALVLAQGDTTTVLATALACFYRRVAFGHVEAGLRTGNKAYPFPEEGHRVVASHLAALHFAPTAQARRNLLHEGIDDRTIHVTGNPGIDALQMTAARPVPIGVELDPTKRLIVLTVHRRENIGRPLEEICRGVRELVRRHGDIEVLCPVHPNPHVKAIVEQGLGRQERIRLCPPLDYGPFVSALKAACLILTDSGGVQEEAPALGKPVLVLRDETERPEAVEAGVVRLVGPHADAIVREASRLLSDAGAYAAMARGVSPYGDGHAAERIVRVVEQTLGLGTP